MSLDSLDIPAEWASKLERVPTEKLDVRTDAEILDSLGDYVPVASEKNIWAFWLTSVDTMPDWCKRNVASWVRMHKGEGWTVRVLDNVSGSSNNALKYVGEQLLTEQFVKQDNSGRWPGQHAADLVRGALLVEHGGVWLDVGCVLFRTMDRGLWGELINKEGAGMGGVWADGCSVNNCYIAARKGDGFMRRWHESYQSLFTNEQTRAHGILASPMWAGLFPLLTPNGSRLKWEWKVDGMTVLQYASHILCQLRLAQLQEPNGFDGVKYWAEKFVLADILAECYQKEDRLGFQSGPRFLELMSICRDDVEHKDFREAECLAWHLLANTSMQKVSRGPGLTVVPELGSLLDQEENKEADIKAGTFFELLRYGAEHFRQTRESIVLVDPPKPAGIIREGILAPVA